MERINDGMASAVRISITQMETTNSTMLKPAVALRGVPGRVALLLKVVPRMRAEIYIP